MSHLVDEFSFQLNKRATMETAHAVMDVAGLGILAAPSLTSKKTKLGRFLHTEKGERLVELVGLGTLAIPSAHFLTKRFGIPRLKI